jgi:large subunit ribosomal protein L17
MCFIELVDYNDDMAKEKVAKKAPRTRRSKKAASDAPAVAAPAVEDAKVIEEAPAAEAVAPEAPAAEEAAPAAEEKPAE